MKKTNQFKIANEMFEKIEKLRDKLFHLRKKACTHPRSARTVTGPHMWSSWPDYGTDPGTIRCEDCNTTLGENWGGRAIQKGKKTYED